jgi:folate-binding protein YgfZ
MAHYLLDDLAILRFRGADAQKFLQGQLSNDVQRLSADVLLRAGLHNPQGRTLALLAMTAVAPDDLLALLPGDLIQAVASQLKRYVLRSKVDISDETTGYRIYGFVNRDSVTPGAGRLCRYGLQDDPRVVLLQSTSQTPLGGSELAVTRWRELDIAAGLPRLSSVTSGQFVAQMLNLDCIDAISFTKGCYTGQEVIARAHYRGRVKRRMQRFVTSTQTLAAGASGRLADGRNFRVVEAVVRTDGNCEFLAVAPLPGAVQETDEAGDAPAQALVVEGLPLPYPLPA